MDYIGFNNYLNLINKAPSTAKHYMDIAVKLENVLGDLDIVVQSDANMENGLVTIEGLFSGKTYVSKFKGVLRHYYVFRNGRKYNNKTNSGRRTSCRGLVAVPYDISGLNFENYVDSVIQGGNNYISNNLIVSYDKGVPNSNKVPGLYEFVLNEAQYILSIGGPVLCSYFSGTFNHLDFLPLHIILDDSTPMSYYGEYNPNNAWKKIKQILDAAVVCDRSIIHKFKRIIANTKNKTHALDEISDLVDNFCMYDDTFAYEPARSIIDQIRQVLEDVSFGCRRLGDFCADKTIHIYYRNFDTHRGDMVYLAEIRNTLAHEIYHFVHNIYAQKTFADSSNNAKRVIESLADFFAFVYTLNDKCMWPAMLTERRMIAKERYVSWQKNLKTAWPYADAIRYTFSGNSSIPNMHYSDLAEDYIKYGSMRLHARVFDYSCTDMKIAFDTLYAGVA